MSRGEPCRPRLEAFLEDVHERISQPQPQSQVGEAGLKVQGFGHFTGNSLSE